MSLIQDALKRKSEEAETVHLPGGIPSAPAEPSPDGKSPQRLVIVLIVLLMAGLIAALAGLSLYLIKPKPQAVAPAAQAIAPAAPVVSEPAPVPETSPVKVSEPEIVKEAAAEPAVQPEPAPENKPVWPELKLTGIAQADNQSLAVLNGKMLPVGRKLGDITLIEVNNKYIVVEYGGERRTLYINE